MSAASSGANSLPSSEWVGTTEHAACRMVRHLNAADSCQWHLSHSADINLTLGRQVPVFASGLWLKLS